MLQEYGPNQEIKKLIEIYARLIFIYSSDYEFRDNGFDATQHYDSFVKFGSLKQIPSFIFKSNAIKRLVNAEMMRRFIQKNNLTFLDVAKKYVCKVTYKNDEELLVLAEKVNHVIVKEGLSLSLKVVQQLTELAEYSGFTDWGTWDTEKNRSKNLLYTTEGTFVFIDTENISFEFGPLFLEANVSLDVKRKICEKLYTSFASGFDEEAKIWLENRIAEHTLNSNEE